MNKAMALEDLMDIKTHMACACCQLNEAIHALEQAQFNLTDDETCELRPKVWDIVDELKAMVESIIDEQAAIRQTFKETLTEDKEE